MTNDLYNRIVAELAAAGQASPYKADADEPDPRYLSYGVRAPAVKQLISDFRSDLSTLGTDAKIELAIRLIDSGYGEQKTVALYLLDQVSDYFSPERFELLDRLIRGLQGWSKIDAYTGSLLRSVLEAHPTEFLALLGAWNSDGDPWLRRASVVIFTRKVARSRAHRGIALKHCDNLKRDPERLVQTGVGWCLRDLMRYDKQQILRYVMKLRRQNVSSTITLYALRDIKGKERQAILSAR